MSLLSEIVLMYTESLVRNEHFEIVLVQFLNGMPAHSDNFCLVSKTVCLKCLYIEETLFSGKLFYTVSYKGSGKKGLFLRFQDDQSSFQQRFHFIVIS
jgi:hypothetical protein